MLDAGAHLGFEPLTVLGQRFELGVGDRLDLAAFHGNAPGQRPLGQLLALVGADVASIAKDRLLIAVAAQAKLTFAVGIGPMVYIKICGIEVDAVNAVGVVSITLRMGIEGKVLMRPSLNRLSLCL